MIEKRVLHELDMRVLHEINFHAQIIKNAATTRKRNVQKQIFGDIIFNCRPPPTFNCILLTLVAGCSNDASLNVFY